MIDVLPRRLSGLPQQAVVISAQLLSAVFLVSVWVGAIYIMIVQYKAKTTAMEISISWFYLALFVGSSGMIIFHARQMVQTFRQTRPESSEAGR